MDDLASLEAMHRGVHAIVDRLVALRQALVAQDFSEMFAEAACLQYSALIMAEVGRQAAAVAPT